MTEAKKPQGPHAAHDLEKVRAQFEAHLTKCGHRFTKQRSVILQALFSAGSHADAESILRQAKKLDSTIGFATVYRTLQLMVAAGVLAERNFGAERRSFEIVGGDTAHHDHLICSNCGTVLEFFDPEVEEMQERIAKKMGFVLTGHRMDLYGNCIRGATCPRRGKSKEKEQS